MRFASTFIYTLMILARAAQAEDGVSADCVELNRNVLARVSQGHSGDAEAMLHSALSDPDRLGPGCAGLVMSNTAVLLSIAGSLVEAEAMAKRAVQNLEQVFRPDDPVLLRPLQTLASVEFGRGETARAREAFNRMQAIRTARPEDRELVDAMAAALSHAEHRWPEAEARYAAAIRYLRESGRGKSADAGALLNGLGTIYIEEDRLSDAVNVLDEALAIFQRDPEADPWDRIKVLQTKAALYARQGKWAEAEQELATVVSAAGHDSRLDPRALKPLLMDYAAILRRNRRRREARSVETRIRSLGTDPEERHVVDVTTLLAERKTRR